MQAAILPLNAGWAWIYQGLVLFLRQPTAMIFWSAITSMLFNLGSAVPLIGQVILITFTPLLTFLTLCACRNLHEKIRMVPKLWLQPVQQEGIMGPMIKLGLLYLGVTFTVAFMSMLPFWSFLLETLSAQNENPDFDALMRALSGPLLVFGLCYLLISAAFWHTPALVGWHKLVIRRALFYSFIASWRNKWPILLYAATWVGLFYALHQLARLMATAGMSSDALAWIILPIDILLKAFLYSSFYPIYLSIFQPGETAQAAQA